MLGGDLQLGIVQTGVLHEDGPTRLDLKCRSCERTYQLVRIR
jgi:hypothetical protein